jgi:hypothetical protein
MVEIFERLHESELTPRFYTAPTLQVAVVRQDGQHYKVSTMRRRLGANMIERSHGRRAHAASVRRPQWQA